MSESSRTRRKGTGVMPVVPSLSGEPLGESAAIEADLIKRLAGECGVTPVMWVSSMLTVHRTVRIVELLPRGPVGWRDEEQGSCSSR